MYASTERCIKHALSLGEEKSVPQKRSVAAARSWRITTRFQASMFRATAALSAQDD